MKIIWTFTLLMIPGVLSSINVTGYSGGGVTITCKYDEQYKTNAKYFCKGQWLSCSELIKTDTKSENKWVQSGRFSLYDNTTAAVFTVTIRDLTRQTYGTYHCGVEVYGTDPIIKVNLKLVTAGPQMGKVRGYSGRNIIIKYRYDKQHKNCQKHVCKTGENHCLSLISIYGGAEWKHSGRFSIRDNRSAGLLRVFIRELNVQDSGKYRIIFRHSEDYSFFSEFDLVITDDASETTASSSPTSPSSSSSSLAESPLQRMCVRK